MLGVSPNPFTVAFRCFHDPNLLLSDNPTLLCDVPERVGGQVNPLKPCSGFLFTQILSKLIQP